MLPSLQSGHVFLDFSTNDVIFLSIHLSPTGLGTVSYYLPTVVLEDDDDVDYNGDDNEAAIHY